MLFCLPNVSGETRLGGWKKGVGECCDMVPDGMSFACYE